MLQSCVLVCCLFEIIEISDSMNGRFLVDEVDEVDEVGEVGEVGEVDGVDGVDAWYAFVSL